MAETPICPFDNPSPENQPTLIEGLTLYTSTVLDIKIKDLYKYSLLSVQKFMWFYSISFYKNIQVCKLKKNKKDDLSKGCSVSLNYKLKRNLKKKK